MADHVSTVEEASALLDPTRLLGFTALRAGRLLFKLSRYFT